MVFSTESEFESALIDILLTKGWESPVLKNSTEQELLDNWASILFENNRDIDRLNNHPLTSGEMQQIIEQITNLRTPLKLNSFINGKTVSITRDNLDDTLHFGKEISLDIYDRFEIAAGQSRYQIVQQPRFSSKSKILNDRRGDLMLLINGMPVIHIELKKSGIPVSQAANQIRKYSREGIFTGLFSLIQVFVAMEPNETLYFANPGIDREFNPDFYFHWADFDNEPISDWKDIASELLNIPMAHQLIGFYTVPDDSDGILKVMRSYQYYAASAIWDRVARTKWEGKDLLGGYIWHTTGSGKTMTSFKSAQLISNSDDADKVIFLMDRVELGTQSLKEYRGFADESDVVQATENTDVLVTKLKSDDPANILIVTSIQKMSNIRHENGMKTADTEKMRAKRIVFIVDEAHRSTFGDMLVTIKNTFPNAIFFGFTGTPIHDENQKNWNTTTTVFGNELHRYSIADGIRDKSVLGFDPYKVLTYSDRDIRKAVAISEAKAKDEKDAVADPAKKKVYYRFMDSAKTPMVGRLEKSGKYIKGIEDYLSSAQYRRSEHQELVVKDILDNWLTLSHAEKFHAIFATNSIAEAIDYYRHIKTQNPALKIAALFDPSIDNLGRSDYKEDGLVEIITDYNNRYDEDFSLSSYAKYKKDIADRLAHKEQHRFIERTPEQQINLLIVVDQMLTGFDSKWINTLYLDKVLKFENLIQAFSRTNRLFGAEKPFGTIKYYRFPHTMERNIKQAVKLYSGDKPLGLFVQQLEENLKELNRLFNEIKRVFEKAEVLHFEKIPDDQASCAKFAILFKALNNYLEASIIQGFRWDKIEYEFSDDFESKKTSVKMDFDENTYLILAIRYRELFTGKEGVVTGSDVPFEIDGRLIEIDTGRIDADYMNSRFDKFMKLVGVPESSKDLTEEALSDLHKTFAMLAQEEQKYAGIFLRDVQRGDVIPEEGKTIRDYITEYQVKAKSDQIHRLALAFGLDEALLREMMNLRLTEGNINEYGRFDSLKDTVNKKSAREFFESQQGERVPPHRANIQFDSLLRRFLLEGGFDLD